jgi:glycosyltransferase involved in cell wall biosynthesis
MAAKIAFLSRYYGTVNRGAETYVIELSKRLESKYQVDILKGSDSDSLSKIVSGKYDFVIPTNGRAQALKCLLGKMAGGYKVIISGQAGIGIDDTFNIAVTKPDVFIALTDYAAQGEKNKLRSAKTWSWGTKVVKIPNGVDLEKFNPVGKKIKIDLKGPVILSVGALAWYKHHERTIEALSKLNKGSLLIVGSGEEKERLEDLANKKIPGRFRIISAEYSELPAIYRSADLFTLPSWDREAFGIVYLEAMASGLGVVAPDDPPRQEIIEEAGVLTNTENPYIFAQALESALNIRWGDAPRKQAEKFSWNKVVIEYDKLFKELKK